jgi:hypothetical protein
VLRRRPDWLDADFAAVGLERFDLQVAHGLLNHAGAVHGLFHDGTFSDLRSQSLLML